MITGYNTDVEYDGVVYHVQTEDKGLSSPLILSLIYVGGAILASKRSSYDDLIAVGFNESVLAERLQRQHKLICAAIDAGRVDELRHMNDRDAAQPVNRPVVKIDQAEALGHASEALRRGLEINPQISPPTPPTPPASPAATSSAHPAQVANKREPTASPIEVTTNTLQLKLLGEGEFRAGEQVTLRISVTEAAEERHPVADASVTVKILGTTFQPMILSAKTAQNGIAVVRTTLPIFASGRAAILIRAAVGERELELRRIIHQA